MQEKLTKKEKVIIKNLLKGLKIVLNNYNIKILETEHNFIFVLKENKNIKKILFKKNVLLKILLAKDLNDIFSLILHKFNLQKHKYNLDNLIKLTEQLFNAKINFAGKYFYRKNVYDTDNTILFSTYLLNVLSINCKSCVNNICLNNKKISKSFIDTLLQHFTLNFVANFLVYNRNEKEVLYFVLNFLKQYFIIKKIKEKIEIQQNNCKIMLTDRKILEIAEIGGLNFLKQNIIFKLYN